MNVMNNNYKNEIENSFAANFWGKGDKGLEVLLNHMRRTKEACDNLNKVLKGRAEIEENYGRQLVELSKNLIDQDEIVSMRDSMETLRLEIEATGQSRIDLALDVKEQITSLLNEFSSNQEKIINNYKIVMERHLYLKNSQTQEVLKVNEKYQKKCEAALAISKKLNTCSEEEVSYYKNLLKQTMIEAKEIDKEYIMVVNRLHQIYRKWQQEWTRKCENFQKFEEDRIRFLFDQMWNYANMFSTVCVADDEGCEKLRVQLEKCDSKKDVIYYIRDHKTGSVITEAPKYINYYSNIQYLEDIVELNGDQKFTIPHSVRSDSRGRIPQQSHIQSQLSQSQQQPQQQPQQQIQSQHSHPIRQQSFPNQFGSGNGNVAMNNQLPMNQNYINGQVYNNQMRQQPSQLQKLQDQNHPNGQPQINNSQKIVETDEEKRNKMKKTSMSSIKKKFSKKRTSLYVTNKSPKNSDDESGNEERENKLFSATTNESITGNNNNDKNNNNDNNNANGSSNSTTKSNNSIVSEDNNADDVNASVMSVVPQIPAVEEEEKRISNILTQSILEEINSESFMKTPIPNDEQHPSHALPPAPVMLDTSIIVPPSSLIKNELDIDEEDKTSLSNNIESLGSDKEEIIQSEKLLVNNENINKKEHHIDEANSNTENTMVTDNDAVESIDENKKVKVEEQALSEILNDQPNDVILTAEVKDVEEIEEKRMEEEINDEQPLVAEIRDAEDMQQKYDDGEEALKSKVQDINEALKSSDFNLDIKPIPTFKELGFRDSYGNYSTTSTDDVESVNIIEESSIEIPDNSSYNRESYNRDSYNSQSYENNLVIIDEDNDVISTNTPNTSKNNMDNLMDTEEADNIPKLDEEDDDEINSDDEADEEVEKDYPVQKSQRSTYNNNNNLQPEFDSIEKDVSTMTIDESLVPIRNTSNEIYNEIQHQKRNTYKKGGQPLPRMERRESLYGISKESYDHNQQPQNPKKVSSVKSTTSKNNETNVAEAAIAAVNNKMMGGIQLQKPSLNNNYSIQTITTSASVSNSSPSYANNYKGTTEQIKEMSSEKEELSADSPTLLYGLHFIPPMLRNQIVQNQEMQLNNKSSLIQNQNANNIINVNNQKQMQNNLNKYPSSVSSNNSNSSAKISKISAINSTGIANNYNNNRGSSQGSIDSNRSQKFGENSKGSPSSVYSNSRNQYYQYKNGAGSTSNNGGINGSNNGSPHSQQQTVNQQQQLQYNSQPVQNQQISQMNQLKIQLMPEYQGQPTTPSQEYIEVNNIPKYPAVELNSTYNPYDLRIKKPVLFSVKTLYDYEAVSFEEVSFKANFVLPILAVQEDGWWETEVNEMKANGTIGRRRGLIPSNFVEVINE